MMLVMGIVIMPEKAIADTSEVEDKIVYDHSYKMSKYWNPGEDGTKAAPVKKGYVFCGWYVQEEDTYKALNSTELTAADDAAVAKFVPAYVLSIMTQLQSGVDENSSSTYLRVITSVDSRSYEKVGFDIWYNNINQETNDRTYVTTVCSSLQKEVNGVTSTIYPEDEFGSLSEYFAVLRIVDIANRHFSKIIYVRPYWVTLDGTKVEGLAKYMHVEDGIYDYYSVPVNLQTGEEIAAGMATMTYDEDLELITTGNEVEAGRILKEMNFKVDTVNRIITFVANSSSTSSKDIADGIFANVRFKIKDDVTSMKDSYQFDISADAFANWNKEFVKNVYAVDYTYN